MPANTLFADTNLFLRYLTNDVPEQADAVEQLLNQAASGAVHLVTNALVIAEIVWTLESYYHLPREQVRRSILGILSTPGLDVSDGSQALQAVLWYVEKNVDYVDAFNAAWCLDRGIETVCTFDRKHFSRLDGIKLHVPTTTP
jgi:predicted nucleic-acid-binding protein